MPGSWWVTRSLGQFPENIDTVALAHPCLLDNAAPGNVQRPVDPELSSGQLTQQLSTHTQGAVNMKQGKKRAGRFGFLKHLLSVAKAAKCWASDFPPALAGAHVSRNSQVHHGCPFAGPGDSCADRLVQPKPWCFVTAPSGVAQKNQGSNWQAPSRDPFSGEISMSERHPTKSSKVIRGP